MIVIPAIDIIDGKPVRLYRGNYNKKEVVGEDILQIVREFQNANVEYIHLVDLDGAKYGRLINDEAILSVVNSIDIPIEVGGGIRSEEDIKYLIDSGISKVILGTAAIENFSFLKEMVKKYKEKIAVAVDCKKGYLCGRGWLEESEISYIEFAKKLEDIGVSNIIVTDIDRDGTLSGVNINMIKELNRNVSMKITSSGGVKNMEDIKKLKAMNIYGAIVGKAIYSKDINLDEAVKYCR